MFSENISLNGSWKLYGRPEVIGRAPGIFHDGPIQIADAAVPGNIELELCRAGMTPEPFFGRNSNAYHAYEGFEWCFEREFTLEDAEGNFELELAGIDCYGTVFINGEKVGNSHNALIPAVFDPSKFLTKGCNTISVHIASPINVFRSEPLVPMAVNICPFGLEQTRMRKPAHSWGWDIAPRLPLGGIFRDVTLRKLKPVRIVDWATVMCDANESEANLRFFCKFETDRHDFAGLIVETEGVCGDSRWFVQQRPWSSQQALCIRVENPVLWWPKHYGEPKLYHASITIRDETSGNVLDCVKFMYGIRSIALEYKPVATYHPEPDFQFIVNGVPIRTWGMNHVPCDALHSRDRERMPQILKLAKEANLNMLRIWGGGIPEDEMFYDFCDREGILIWHDFMYGCALYPDDDAFLKEAEHEAIEILRVRRHHACIALWAGDNECDSATYFMRSRYRDPAHNKLTREILPQVCERYAPGAVYLPSSPYISEECQKKGRESGVRDASLMAPEQHLWGSHEYFKNDFYKATTSFVSETGYHACPNVSALKKFLPAEKLWPWDNDDWYHHACNPFMPNMDYNYRIQIIPDQIAEFFGEIPDGLEAFALASQICQAEANQYFLERARASRKYSGMLIWNLIDCWPHFSDSVVDYYYGKKLSYYYCKRHMNDFLIMAGDAADWHWAITMCNDSNRTRRGVYTIRAYQGEVLVSGEFTAAPGEIRQLTRIRCLATDQQLLLIEWEFDDGTRGGNHKVTGTPRYDFRKFRDEWLPAIAALDNGFNAAEIGR